MKKEIKKGDIWKYKNILKKETKESIFSKGKQALQQKKYDIKNVVDKIEKSSFEQNQNEKELKKELGSISKEKDNVKSVWKKENENKKQIEQNNKKRNAEIIQNIVKSSLEQREEQNQKKQQIQEKQQNMDINTLFLNMTEKLLEQRERSLKSSQIKI